MARISIRVNNVSKEFKRLEAELMKEVNLALRISSFQAYAALQMATPVKTGRARSSWNLSAFANTFSQGNGSVGLLPPPSSTKFDTLYLSNGVPYITDLNMGNSQQAPARFIEKTVSRFFSPKGAVVTVK
jgi:hypothetical protein